MAIEVNRDNLDNVIVIADRVLVKPSTTKEQTNSGLYLPPGVQEKEKVHSGYVIKAGPGYPIPAITEEDEPWKDKKENVKYVPLQVREGDLVLYLQNSGYEVIIQKEKYIILPHSAILMLFRDEGLFA